MKFIIIASLFLGSFHFALAQSTVKDAPPVKVEEVMRFLENLEKKRTEDFKSNLKRAIRDFSSAAGSESSASQFYVEAVGATRFPDSKQAVEFNEWRQKERETLFNPVFQKAVQLHLRYLLFVLRTADGAKVETMIGEVMSYLRDLENFREEQNKKAELAARMQRNEEIREKMIPKQKGGKGGGPKGGGKSGGGGGDAEMSQMAQVLETPIQGSLFVKWYQIEESCSKKSSDWEPNPGNLEGIYDKTIFPFYREKKDPKLIELWNAKIDRACAKIKDSDISSKQDDFDFKVMPKLRWDRAREMIAINMRNRGLSEMYAVVKEFPEHGSFTSWIGDLKRLLADPNAPLDDPATIPTDAAQMPEGSQPEPATPTEP